MNDDDELEEIIEQLLRQQIQEDGQASYWLRLQRVLRNYKPNPRLAKRKNLPNLHNQETIYTPEIKSAPSMPGYQAREHIIHDCPPGFEYRPPTSVNIGSRTMILDRGRCVSKFLPDYY